MENRNPVARQVCLRRRTDRPYGGFARSAFSMLELLVVIAVTVVLTGLLMPALRHVHENANRLICMSHLQQLGHGITLYAMHNDERLPYSMILNVDNSPPDLMAARRGGSQPKWDGLGLLFEGTYCPAPECFYCPSHMGNHTYDRYADAWSNPQQYLPIYTNYHYAGDVFWQDKTRRRTLDEGHMMILATDGLRTAQDFNHRDGMNVLRADISVRWRDDTQNIRKQLPAHDGAPPWPHYQALWTSLETTN